MSVIDNHTVGERDEYGLGQAIQMARHTANSLMKYPSSGGAVYLFIICGDNYML
ncbi:hypothetical protein O1Q98_00480 [Dickeya lacustris]|uniref:Uncharacterized protein n=1 Tax=Dickeya lacustris TaxID=2259638 RepID=A0ABY8G7A5_9GAMM|nr:hypothetical protein [Dickeya lacustris]WFN55847.1 hypothetical protein O1Q98_00480 [Dickeya lacustris]